MGQQHSTTNFGVIPVLLGVFALLGSPAYLYAIPPAPRRDPPTSLRRMPASESPRTANSAHSVSASARVAKSVEPSESPTPAKSAASEDSLADAEADVERELYSNGAVRTSREVLHLPSGKTVSHGAWRWWDEAGQLIASGDFQDGKREGVWKRSYDPTESPTFAEEPYVGFTAPFHSVAGFQAGLLHGEWKISDARGRPIVSIQYREGQRDGIAIWWNPQGQKTQQVEYRAGLLEGDFVKWDSRGEEIFRRGFQESREILIDSTSHPNGRRRSAVTVLSAPLRPEGKDDWWTANRALYRPEGREERQGMALQWYANGQVRRQGDFDEDQPVGTHSWWYENGQLTARGDYHRGAPHGPWTWWHLNGQEQAKGEFDDGQPVGTWTWFREDGSVQAESSRVGSVTQSADRDATPLPPKAR
jgi:antitoxin component YwqK of YwqJK toxin-antitoxin module